MNAESLIQVSWFYLAENEKNKKNWFLYEFALKYFDYLKASRNESVAKWVASQSEEQLAEYCAYFAKRMRNNTARHHYRDLGGDIADDEYNRDYCHFNTQADNEALAEVAEAAWLDLLDSCSTCPTNCLNEGLMPCTMFDKMENGGKPW
jgi:predicted CxxxxCH...CXXCH cytochrome family protein